MDNRKGQLSGILRAVFLYIKTRGEILCCIKNCLMVWMLLLERSMMKMELFSTKEKEK